MEEIPTQATITPEEELCETIYTQTTKRSNSGRYTVQLPFKDQLGPTLGASRSNALAQYFRLEKRLHKEPKLLEQYRSCIQEYIDLGHMVQVPPPPLDNQTQVYYMPHHGVTKETSTTTKLRVVFNASCQSSNGKSLNEQMLVGPTIQQTLWTTLLQWRMFKIVFSADIEKMYRMINMDPTHHNLQRIIWRNHPDEPLKDYALTTVTFGTSAAPFLAIRTLHQLATDEADNFPNAAEVLRNQCYVDDVISGGFDVEKTKELQKNLIDLLQRGGFKLRKWTSNHAALLSHLPPEYRESATIHEWADAATVKTLGLQWRPESDEFCFSVDLPPVSSVYTKRKILSEVSTLFDPFGWIAPTIILGKFLIQQLWLSGCDWDEPAPEPLQNRWKEMREALPELRKIRIPRWTQWTPHASSVELHGFSDASTHGYAAVIYIKVKASSSKYCTKLLTCKSKVAPVKTVSVPRLELCGAHLLAKTMRHVIGDLKLDATRTFYWTDSQITLAWIRSSPTRWKTFVANRTSEITCLSDPSNWRYVPSKDNPADHASRGQLPSELIQNQQWWSGPSWLNQTQEEWPEQPEVTEPREEAKAVKVFFVHQPWDILCRFSSINKLKRVVAFMLRFIQKTRKVTTEEIYLTSTELQNAENLILKIVQREEFHAELQDLKQGKTIGSKSTIKSLTPFLDSNGLIRVGGRIQSSIASYNMKHPVILPRRHHVTNLIINDIHHRTLHGGTQLVLNTLRMKYWITSARPTVKGRLRGCVTCKRSEPRPQQQIMGNLPHHRTNQSLAFEHTGVDFAGPFNVKTSKIRNAKNIKGYICVFVCMATKAIHLELTTDLTTDTFMAALRRFVSRRGRCSHLYSDCGTNFIKANRLLTTKIAEETNREDIRWHFNPPSAPHFGGLWEAGVKSVKTHLKRILGSTSLVYEELNTLLCQIEAALNSRPLTPLYCSPDDQNFLTPGHGEKHFIGPRNLII